MTVSRWLVALALAVPLPTPTPILQLPLATSLPTLAPALPPAPVGAPAPLPSPTVDVTATSPLPGTTVSVPGTGSGPAPSPSLSGSTPSPGSAAGGGVLPGGGSQAGPAASPGGEEEPPPPARNLLQIAADTPLGSAPPIVGIVLLAISIGLFIRRRVEEDERRKALERAKTEFLKVASHELRTPLTVVRGYFSMLEEGALGEPPERMRRMLPSVGGKLGELDHLVDQLLEAARLDERALKLKPAPADLRDLVTRSVTAARENLDVRHSLALEVPPEPVPVRVDPTRFGMVLGNLLDNAVKFSPAGGEVRCRVAVAGGRAEVSVEDHGLGIARDQLPGIFQRFGRIVTPENSSIPGSGLGLFLARELIRMHRGDVRVSSEVGRGSVFTVSLPLAVPLWRRLPVRRRDQTLAPTPLATYEPSSE